MTDYEIACWTDPIFRVFHLISACEIFANLITEQMYFGIKVRWKIELKSSLNC